MASPVFRLNSSPSPDHYDVRLVYPLIASKTIVTVDLDGETNATEASFAKQAGIGDSLFDELVYCPDLLERIVWSFSPVQVAVTEVRCADGLGRLASQAGEHP